MTTPLVRFSSLGIGLLVCAATASALDVAVKEVKDSRTTGQFFKNLEVEFALKGAELANAKAVRTSVKSAKDSTGKNLLTEDSSSTSFSELSGFGDAEERAITVKLANPERKAETLSELKGEIEFYVPSRDPAAIVTLPGVPKQLGKPVAHPALKSAGVELTIHTDASYAALRKQEREKQVAEMKAQGASPEMIEMATSFMDSMNGGTENSIILLVKDPQKRLIGVDFQTAAGEKIETNGSMTSSDQKTIYFSQPLPSDYTAQIQLLTDKAVVKAPLQLANVQLP